MDIQTLLQIYFADPNAQQEELNRIQRRATNINQLRAITQRFIAGGTNLETFRNELEAELHAREDWGATGPGFLMGLNQLIKNHQGGSTNIEAYLRDILYGLDASTLGPRIEQLENFLLTERSRLRQIGKGNIAMAAGNSAFFLSIFAAWLDTVNQPDIYFLSLREGLYKLVKTNIISPPKGLSIGWRAVEVHTNTQHMAYVQLMQDIKSYVPVQKLVPYWTESFGLWVKNYFSSTKVTNEPDDNGPFSLPQSPEGSVIKDGSTPYTVEAQEQFITNEPLSLTPEPLLTKLIHEVQRHILIEESIIRRIYHALLAGHVVLSGPPGTGKTELARLLPEILWRNGIEDNSDGHASPSAYTTRLVTATDEWSVRTLISGIAPVSKNGNVAYKIQYGHLTSAILKNWSAQGETPTKWSTLTLRRTPVTSHSGVERGTEQTFRGQWLIIDEFNRAPIDLALGEALTALGGNDVLRVMTEDGSMELPIPKDFRVIGTLNSFDRNYLNQISEALKRRFSFVEILPPGRNLREAEQAVVLYKALERVSHLSKEIVAEENGIAWSTIGIETNTDEGLYNITWPDELHPFREAFEAAWRVFETIRVYRQLGTAQAISLVRHMLIAGILQNYTTREQWIGEALDTALCDTIADQLQVLLPDEIETLLLALTSEQAAFSAAYHRLLANLADRQQRLYGQLLALGRVSDEHGVAYLSDEEIEASAQSSPPTVAETKLRAIFHLDAPLYRLPQFTRRLRAFKAERGL